MSIEDPKRRAGGLREAGAEAASSNPGTTSVILVGFESGALLARAVRSVLASRSPVEVIVVDNASRDGSVERLLAAVDDPRLRVLVNEGNLGFARANNRALPLAHGDFLLFLNPDCVVSPETIGRMRAIVEGRPRAGMAGCLIRNPDGSEQAGCRRESPTPGKALVRAFGLARWARSLGIETDRLRDFVRVGDPLPVEPTAVDAISGAFMFVRRQALAEVGPLDEGYFLHCEDLDWCERFRRAGWVVLFVPEIEITHDKGGSSRGRPVRVLWHMHRGMIRFYGKFYRATHPRPLLWLVSLGVWLRFGALAAAALFGHVCRWARGR